MSVAILIPSIIDNFVKLGQFDFSISGEIECSVGFKYGTIRCSSNIAGSVISYIIQIDVNKPKYCRTSSKDSGHITNRLCKQETGKNGDCGYTDYCLYHY